MEAQSYRSSFDEIPSVKYIANYVGRQQQMYVIWKIEYIVIHNEEEDVLLVSVPLFVVWMENKAVYLLQILLVL